ncbi:hypothetical protein BWQ96_08678 [Gracilariopsis chorda]|uniref:Uncharacterized protein n=1 Tax=Gracilariopsis chorda TaxID=448386 RepID=A0A2V3IHP8_9FLOR|nr:hypothetical protein BWQ96_08678 [Gracilariopsis chorda]|eukprot:PXF41591.1 hypothetical protein BWQ96_08678 [Gracilariopsis chorda]
MQRLKKQNQSIFMKADSGNDFKLSQPEAELTVNDLVLSGFNGMERSLLATAGK